MSVAMPKIFISFEEEEFKRLMKIKNSAPSIFLVPCIMLKLKSCKLLIFLYKKH